MKISDQIGLAVTNLSRRKGRTALTVVGVVVGICAVIVMVPIIVNFVLISLLRHYAIKQV